MVNMASGTPKLSSGIASGCEDPDGHLIEAGTTLRFSGGTYEEGYTHIISTNPEVSMRCVAMLAPTR
jgi:hypothetical protein